MKKHTLEKILVGGAILLSFTNEAFREQKPILPVQIYSKIQSILKTRDPLAPTKNLEYCQNPEYYKILEKQIKDSLDGLALRLENDGFDRKKIQAFYNDKRFEIRPDLADYFAFRPGKKVTTYDGYREQLELDKKIATGPDFFKKYAFYLFEAEKKYGVAAEVIAAILGVESNYGTNLGEHRAFNTAIALYSSKNKKSAYRQIKALIRLGEERKMDIMEIYSSHAVCSFAGQFLIENIPLLFVSRNNDSKGDLYSIPDWIHSIANYLNKAGWNSKQNKARTKGTANWKAIWAYNHSGYYVRANDELAVSIARDPEIILLREQYNKTDTLIKEIAGILSKI